MQCIVQVITVFLFVYLCSAAMFLCFNVLSFIPAFRGLIQVKFTINWITMR